MGQNIAVAMIHGMGNQAAEFGDGLRGDIRQGFRRQLGQEPDDLIFRSAHWAPVLAGRERQLWQAVSTGADLDFVKLRRFTIDFLADAIAYQRSDSRHQVYDAIHEILATALAGLAVEAGADAPLCVIATSLGSVIAHNYFYDLAKPHPGAEVKETALERGETLTLFVTTGSPLALWSLRYGDDYQPLPFPGAKVSKLYPAATPDWLNFYDKDDVLAYPVGNLTARHRTLVARGLLTDVPVNVGTLLTSWNPLSHSGYWQDADVTQPVTRQLVDLWKAINA